MREIRILEKHLGSTSDNDMRREFLGRIHSLYQLRTLPYEANKEEPEDLLTGSDYVRQQLRNK